MRVSGAAERRFVLGAQGLWPGRRWRGPAGIRAALTELRRVQVDSIDIVGRNQDLVFSSRVDGYRREDLDRLLYTDRAGFEHGGNLNIFPVDRLRLQYSWFRHEGIPPRWDAWARANAAAVARVRAAIRRDGPMESRDWGDGEAVDHYRASRAEGVALHYLWRRFEIMVDHREGNRKFYDRTERLFGALPRPFPRAETRDLTNWESLARLGLSGRSGLRYLRAQEDGHGRASISKRALRDRLLADGRLVAVDREVGRDLLVLPAELLPALEAVVHGEVPPAWRPLSSETEAVFLPPLDIVVADGRAKEMFDFEHLVEFYKPASARRWGYYVLPILLGDALVGRIEPVVDRNRGVLVVTRAWWEDGVRLPDVVEPFVRALGRMADGLGVREVRLGKVGPPAFRAAVDRALRRRNRRE